MNFIQLFSNKIIRIPLLQRDYVQGGREDVISPFIDSLLGEECDLNYIYGYEESDCFVPVDGQQRLTTLWLLYLYLYARKGCTKEFNVGIKFTSREYAEDFCEELSKYLEKLLKKLEDKASIDLDKEIINQNWFIRSWFSNTSVRNMLNAIKVIHRKIDSGNFSSIWDRLVESSVPSITFAFLQMKEDNGLDDDIYIKMNGRGRKLSVFENLKSFMDEYMDKHRDKLQFADDWRNNMDNMWTDMFWNNRNQQQEHPEEIDDEQLHCFYNLLILYHIDKGELLATVQNIDRHLYENLVMFLGKDENSKEEDIVSSIIERLQKAGSFSLVWFERLKLLSEGFYDFAFHKLNTLATLSQQLNDENGPYKELYIGASPSERTKKIYQICMCEGSFNRTLPLLYALLAYRGGCTPLFDWLRTMRNLILNTEISREDLPSIMRSIDDFGIRCFDRNIYSVLLSGEGKVVLKGFNENQVEEEILKASALEYKDQMVKLENGRFFSGCIGVLFRLLSYSGEPDCYDLMSQENVTAYTSVLLAVFDGSDKGVAHKFDDVRYLLRRALISYKPYRFGKERKSYWSFNNGINEWREYINSKESEIGAFQLLLKELLVPAFKSHKDIDTVLSEYVETIAMNYERDILINDDFSYRYYFIHYPCIWEYMSTQKCRWGNNNFDIELKASNSNNGNRMELRTMSLYLDYRDNEEYIPDYAGWEIGMWQKGKSCLCFDFKILPNNQRTIAIDVYFYDDNENRYNEDCYSFDLFLRPPSHRVPVNEEEEKAFADDDYNQNRNLFSSLIRGQMELFTRKQDGRLHSNRLYSRQELRKVLKNIMSGIKTAFAEKR